MSEKDYLLEEVTPNKPSFTRLLSNPFQCLPSFKSTESTYDYSDDDVFEPLPYTSSSKSTIQSHLTNNDKLSHLRHQMRQRGIAVYIIPSEDEHQSEYTATADKRREFTSEFTGSAGIAIVTLDDEFNGEQRLSTDGRYFLQAEEQLPNTWGLLKQGMAGYPKWTSWCIEKATTSKFSKVISVDSRLISLDTGEFFQKASKINGFEFKPQLENLVDAVWDNRPMRSLDLIYQYEMKFAGESTNDKLVRVRKEMAKLGGEYLVITALDDIAWLLNLRADTDIDFAPVFFSYVLITPDTVRFYVDYRKLHYPSIQYLQTIEGLEIKKYTDFYSDLGLLKCTVEHPIGKIILPTKSSATYALYEAIPESIVKRTIIFHSIVSYLKVYKNPTELFNYKIAQYKDSLAFIIFSAWLEDQLLKGKKINEFQAACKIHGIRGKFPNFKGESYETISSTGANGAIIHYAPSEDQNSIIDPKKIYLIDSGAQYLEGTTDITRTYMFGDASKEDKKFYTLVLKGHLAVSMAKFPANSSLSGAILDSYSRQPLWNEGLDFNHGSGHGVGAFGLVHESPLYFSTTAGGSSTEPLFKPGAIITIEPGYYVAGEKGFRVESELEIIKTDSKTRNGEDFLGFGYLTKVPFCRKLIDKSYLDSTEINWINEFYKSIRSDFGDKLSEMDKRAYDWLMKETKPL
ncbi:putative Xaa-Pro aminopeptidase Fra1p [[Candida] jaroonii]|uniref:Xaa-Pro aminopeptidase Fra1p n=1 Tax=[Candida] jaroonii TaxID=467808 RepID=A0ACA9Y1F5_9ASCO|nr:putative Xaa-Pro aminopeptidase Fra1p [[Candida] jaroonii]